jgi:hypothetical protein
MQTSEMLCVEHVHSGPKPQMTGLNVSLALLVINATTLAQANSSALPVPILLMGITLPARPALLAHTAPLSMTLRSRAPQGRTLATKQQVAQPAPWALNVWIPEIAPWLVAPEATVLEEPLAAPSVQVGAIVRRPTPLPSHVLLATTPLTVPSRA